MTKYSDHPTHWDIKTAGKKMYGFNITESYEAYRGGRLMPRGSGRPRFGHAFYNPIRDQIEFKRP